MRCWDNECAGALPAWELIQAGFSVSCLRHCRPLSHWHPEHRWAFLSHLNKVPRKRHTNLCLCSFYKKSAGRREYPSQRHILCTFHGGAGIPRGGLEKGALPECCRLDVCVPPPKFMCYTLTSNVMVGEGVAFGR